MKKPTRSTATVRKAASRKAVPSKTAAKRSRQTDASDDGIAGERVAVAGIVPGRVSQIRGSTLSLVTLCGEMDDGEDVMIPLIDWQLFGKKELGEQLEEQDAGNELASHLIALDNMAFVFNRVGHDLQAAVRQLVAQSHGGIVPLRSRMRYTADMLRSASDQFAFAADSLSIGLLDGEDDPDIE